MAVENVGNLLKSVVSDLGGEGGGRGGSMSLVNEVNLIFGFARGRF